MSALPPSSAFVSNWLTPPPPFVSNDHYLPTPNPLSLPADVICEQPLIVMMMIILTIVVIVTMVIIVRMIKKNLTGCHETSHPCSVANTLPYPDPTLN